MYRHHLAKQDPTNHVNFEANDGGNGFYGSPQKQLNLGF